MYIAVGRCPVVQIMYNGVTRSITPPSHRHRSPTTAVITSAVESKITVTDTVVTNTIVTVKATESQSQSQNQIQNQYPFDTCRRREVQVPAVVSAPIQPPPLHIWTPRLLDSSLLSPLLSAQIRYRSRLNQKPEGWEYHPAALGFCGGLAV